MIVHDMLGMFEAFTPKFAKKYANIGEQIVKALRVFAEETEKGIFPAPEHCYRMPQEEIERLEKMLKSRARSSRSARRAGGFRIIPV
jgi:3-methyl-2-oxobutanoate hydroxymethyltransferase